jgi:rare lipoprotein A
MRFTCNRVTIPGLYLFVFFTLALTVQARGQLSSQASNTEEGLASYYAGKFHGRLTANGEIFDTYRFTAAHKTLPFNTIVRVTSKVSGKSVLVRINDRGPFVPGRIIDLSRIAASAIDMVGTGLAAVTVEVVELGDGRTHHKSGPPSETVTIQVGAYSDQNNADDAVRKLEAVRLKPVLEATGTGFQRVVLQEIPKDDLDLTRLKLADLGFTEVLVRP